MLPHLACSDASWPLVLLYNHRKQHFNSGLSQCRSAAAPHESHIWRAALT